jgi:glycosyltransferase involved in cell wall biosynthesis
MAAGKPVVATSVGGNPEIVVQNQTGFLVPPGNSAKVAEAINVLLEDEELARKMGKNGFARVREKFSLERMVADYEQIYDFWIRKKIGIRLPYDGRDYDS